MLAEDHTQLMCVAAAKGQKLILSSKILAESYDSISETKHKQRHQISYENHRGVVTEGTLISRKIITEQIERNASKVAY